LNTTLQNEGSNVDQEPETSNTTAMMESLRSVLIVRPDDEALKVWLWSHFLLHRQGWGQLVVTFLAQTALEIAERLRPDLILNDIMLVQMDGIELLRRLKAHPELSDVPVVMASPRCDPETVSECLELGAADFLCEPLPMDDTLARTVSVALAGVVRTSPSIERLRTLREYARNKGSYSPLLQFISKLSPEYAVPSSLYHKGYAIAPSYDATSAIRMARRILPDVIFTSFDLPDMMGVELLAQLKADPVVSDIPVVMLGSSEPDQQRRAMALGAHAIYEGKISTGFRESDAGFMEILNSALGRK
jgi:CheY-like chemotaxis protein